jgi:hypothetical protein
VGEKVFFSEEVGASNVGRVPAIAVFYEVAGLWDRLYIILTAWDNKGSEQ